GSSIRRCWRLASTAASRRPASRRTRRMWVITPSTARPKVSSASSQKTPPTPPNIPAQTKPATKMATHQANRMRNARNRLEDTWGPRAGRMRARIAAAAGNGTGDATKPGIGRRNRGRRARRARRPAASTAGMRGRPAPSVGGGVADALPDLVEHLAGLGLAEQAHGHALAAQEQLQALARGGARVVEVDVVGGAQHRPVAGEAAHGPGPGQRLVALAPVVAFAVDVDHDRLARRR